METRTAQEWPEWMGTRTVARYLDTTPKAITRRVERGTFLKPAKMGKLNKWRRADIDEWLERKP